MSSYGKGIMMPTRQSSQLGTHGTISELPEERLLGTKVCGSDKLHRNFNFVHG